MSTLKASELLESAVQVTEERDEARLRLSLIRTIRELLPAQSAVMLRVDDRPDGVRVEARQEPAQADELELCGVLNANPLLLREVLANGQPGVAEMGTERSVFVQRVRSRRPAGEVLAASLDRADAESLRVLTSFTRLYSNFIQVVNEAERDRLTGLLNRRCFDRQLARVIERGEVEWAAQERVRPQQERMWRWLALFDVDHFKRINDSFGHLYGDEVLLLLARLVQRCFRDEDCCFRYGGEEFAVLVAPSTPEGMAVAMERLRTQIERYNFPQIGRVTISIGYAALESGLGPADLIDRADRALYAAKGGGRNRALSYESLPPSQKPAHNRSGEVELF